MLHSLLQNNPCLSKARRDNKFKGGLQKETKGWSRELPSLARASAQKLVSL
jgi:hypothetical protein